MGGQRAAKNDRHYEDKDEIHAEIVANGLWPYNFISRTFFFCFTKNRHWEDGICYTSRMKAFADYRCILVRVDLRQKAARDLLGGVLRYATEHPHWDVQILHGHPLNGFSSKAIKRVDGLITDFALTQNSVRHLAAAGLRAMVAAYDDTSLDPVHPPFALRHICCDNEDIGRTAARFLLSKRLEHFAYVPATVPNQFLRHRQESFCQAISFGGGDVSVYKSQPSSRDNASLASWLASLPKPCGVLAEFDQRAKNVIDACRLAGLKIPEQLLVLGIDNEDYICENTLPTLSSVWPDFTRGGLLASETLERMLNGEQVGGHALAYGVRQIVERISTADVNGTARTVAIATEYIRQHSAEPIHIADIARAAGTSERLLEKHFRAVLKTTAVRELQRIRLDHVKELLRNSDLPLTRIGEICGFRGETHLKVLFKRTTGLTMSDYRRQRDKLNG